MFLTVRVSFYILPREIQEGDGREKGGKGGDRCSSRSIDRDVLAFIARLSALGVLNQGGGGERGRG